MWTRGVKLLASVDISTRAPWIMLNEQHIMACTHCKIVLGCKIPHELDALKWKAIGRRRRMWTSWRDLRKDIQMKAQKKCT
jgi:hypothetical protein